MPYCGIDYGRGTTNIDTQTRIRYGVISQHALSGDALNDLESEYGDPHCPKCGDPTLAADAIPETANDWENGSAHGCNDHACGICELWWDSDECYPDEPIGLSYNGEGYALSDCLDTDLFVTRSPFYTYTMFCSPCVPGAGNLDSPLEGGVKTYCLGHDWFEGGRAPYPVYRVEDDVLVEPEV